MANLSEKLTVARKKNFIELNILRVKHSRPTEPKQRYADTRYGDTHDLMRSGLLPIYVHKKGYGKVLKSVAKAMAKDTETEQYDDEDKIFKIPSCRLIDKEERSMLLENMKIKWEEMMKRFQGLPFLVDTPPKAQKKAKMERELQQLEKDIELIEQHPYIYIHDANDV